MNPGEFEIKVKFSADDHGIAEALADIIQSVAPWMVDNVKVTIDSHYYEYGVDE